MLIGRCRRVAPPPIGGDPENFLPFLKLGGRVLEPDGVRGGVGVGLTQGLFLDICHEYFGHNCSSEQYRDPSNGYSLFTFPSLMFCEYRMVTVTAKMAS